MKDAVILSAVRTPIGSFLGTLKDLAAPQLAAVCVAEAIRRAGVDAHEIDECLMGCVLSAGLGQAPARQSVLLAGVADSIRCTTINRVCGSGLKSVMLGAQMIQCGDARVVIAGGMESMSRAPYLLTRARQGYRLGHSQVIDSMVHDGLWDVYNNFHMGSAAELCAREKKLSREAQDAYARTSYERAQRAITQG